MKDQRPLLFMILDGWGVNSRHEGNAIYEASTPNLDRLLANYPSSTISVSGPDVGLPEGQMGNSEVGHMHLGSGRVVFQDLTLIHRAIDDGTFFSNKNLIAGMEAVQRAGGRLHVLGLLGDGGVHSHQRHLEALIELARRRKVPQTFLHLFLDGRDTSPTSGEGFARALDEKLKAYPEVRIATLCGRYYAMDRDKRWERTEKAYRLYTEGLGETVSSAMEAIQKSYRDGKTDEFLAPSIMAGCGAQGRIRDNDAVIFFNFRADRVRQLTRALTEKEFKEFPRERVVVFSSFVTMTEYHASFKLPAAFPSRRLVHTIGEIISGEGLPQLRIAETEKYAHVTYFFNGGEENEFAKEKRILIPSNRQVATYDLKPEMSAYDITGALLKEIASDQYALIILNYANPDMV
ncbi:MAG TPA: 2,3-bisphosphoglycerate-independent phosphoglycerate mutase, partial [Candidatus Binatia bacterium]